MSETTPQARQAGPHNPDRELALEILCMYDDAITTEELVQRLTSKIAEIRAAAQPQAGEREQALPHELDPRKRHEYMESSDVLREAEWWLPIAHKGEVPANCRCLLCNRIRVLRSDGQPAPPASARAEREALHGFVGFFDGGYALGLNPSYQETFRILVANARAALAGRTPERKALVTAALECADELEKAWASMGQINPNRFVAATRAAARTPEPAPATPRHGIDCPKMKHGVDLEYAHGADDDTPYDIDGVMYCGRCHSWMEIPPRAATPGETKR